MIYIVNGFPGCGKTTFEDFVIERMGRAYSFKLSTIDFVKKIAQQCGWNGTKDLKNRKFLSDLKDLLTEWDDVPYKKILPQIEQIKYYCQFSHQDFERYAIFIDCREPKEIKKFCDRLGAKSVLIRRPGDKNTPTLNHADQEILDYDYDITIYNDGDLVALADTVDHFIKDENLYCLA